MLRLLIAISVVLTLAPPLLAGPIVNVTLTGEAANVVDASGILSGVSIGDPIAVSFSYMLDLPDGDPAPGFGIYSNSIISATAAIGSHAFEFSAPGSSSLSFIPGPGTHGFLALASFDDAAVVAGPDAGASPDDLPVTFALQLLAQFGGVLATDNLVPLPTAGWTDGISLFANRTDSTRVDFRVDLESIQSTVTHPVPEPRTTILVLSGLLGLAALRRRRASSRR